jgi:hypothetical protein
MKTLLWLPRTPEPRLATVAGIIRGGVMGNPLHVSIHKTVMNRWLARAGLTPMLENPVGVHWWDVGLVLKTLMEDEKGQKLFKTDPDFLELAAEHVTMWPEGWTVVTIPLPWSLSQEFGYSHADLTKLVMSATMRGELANYGLAACPTAGVWCLEEVKGLLEDLKRKGAKQ